MPNLIVVIISIALVAVMAGLASYLGSDLADDARSRVMAAELINKSEQIWGASQLYYTETGEWPASVVVLTAGSKYLSTSPLPPNEAYVKPTAGYAWTDPDLGGLPNLGVSHAYSEELSVDETDEALREKLQVMATLGRMFPRSIDKTLAQLQHYTEGERQNAAAALDQAIQDQAADFPKPNAMDWVWPADAAEGERYMLLSQRMSESACRAINLTYAGDSTIRLNPVFGRTAQCYGGSEPYTYLWMMPGSESQAVCNRLHADIGLPCESPTDADEQKRKVAEQCPSNGPEGELGRKLCLCETARRNALEHPGGSQAYIAAELCLEANPTLPPVEDPPVGDETRECSAIVPEMVAWMEGQGIISNGASYGWLRLNPGQPSGPRYALAGLPVESNNQIYYTDWLPVTPALGADWTTAMPMLAPFDVEAVVAAAAAAGYSYLEDSASSASDRVQLQLFKRTSLNRLCAVMFTVKTGNGAGQTCTGTECSSTCTGSDCNTLTPITCRGDNCTITSPHGCSGATCSATCEGADCSTGTPITCSGPKCTVYTQACPNAKHAVGHITQVMPYDGYQFYESVFEPGQLVMDAIRDPGSTVTLRIGASPTLAEWVIIGGGASRPMAPLAMSDGASVDGRLDCSRGARCTVYGYAIKLEVVTSAGVKYIVNVTQAHGIGEDSGINPFVSQSIGGWLEAKYRLRDYDKSTLSTYFVPVSHYNSRTHFPEAGQGAKSTAFSIFGTGVAVSTFGSSQCAVPTSIPESPYWVDNSSSGGGGGGGGGGTTPASNEGSPLWQGESSGSYLDICRYRYLRLYPTATDWDPDTECPIIMGYPITDPVVPNYLPCTPGTKRVIGSWREHPPLPNGAPVSSTWVTMGGGTQITVSGECWEPGDTAYFGVTSPPMPIDNITCWNEENALPQCSGTISANPAFVSSMQHMEERLSWNGVPTTVYHVPIFIGIEGIPVPPPGWSGVDPVWRSYPYISYVEDWNGVYN